MFGEIVGGGLSAAGSYAAAKEQAASNERIAAQNLAYQREFAQSGVQWKTSDAIKAGIHPLAALGAQTHAFSPSQVGGSESGGGAAMKEMGQAVTRAFKAAQAEEDRKVHDEAEARKLQLENAGLQNEVLRQKLASDRVVSGRAQPGILGPPMPTPPVIPIPRPGPRRSVEGDAIKEKDLEQTRIDVPSPESGRPFGYEVSYNPYFGSGQAFEDRYGDSELAQTLKFLVNTGADHYMTARDRWLPAIDRWGRSDSIYRYIRGRR